MSNSAVFLGSASVHTAVLGALDGDGSVGDPLLVQVDGVTVTINPSNELVASSGGTPGGSNTQVQFNDSGAFGGDAGLTYDPTSGLLTSRPITSTASGFFATMTTAQAGANTNLTYTASEAGSGGNGIFIEYDDPGMANQSLIYSEDVPGKTITISLATNGASALISTALDVLVSVNSNSTLVDADVAPGSDGSGVVAQDFSFPVLSGGNEAFIVDGSFSLDGGTIVSDGARTWEATGGWELEAHLPAIGEASLSLLPTGAATSLWYVDRADGVTEGAFVIYLAGAPFTSFYVTDIGGTGLNTVRLEPGGGANALYPTDGTPDLGTALLPWKDGFFSGAVKAADVIVSGDAGSGQASTTSLTNAVNTTLTNAYIVKGGQAATTANTGWLKIYIGTAVAWVPYWANATP